MISALPNPAHMKERIWTSNHGHLIRPFSTNHTSGARKQRTSLLRSPAFSRPISLGLPHRAKGNLPHLHKISPSSVPGDPPPRESPAGDGLSYPRGPSPQLSRNSADLRRHDRDFLGMGSFVSGRAEKIRHRQIIRNEIVSTGGGAATPPYRQNVNVVSEPLLHGSQQITEIFTDVKEEAFFCAKNTRFGKT